jgi:hypothetical protein
MNYKSISKLFMLGFILAFMFSSCTKEGPMGPAGANGVDGTNGTDGTDGVDGIAFCLECHTSTTIDNLTAQWSGSGHATGSSLGYAGARSGCSECHSGVGFSAYLAGSEDISGSPIGCSACHSHGEPPVFQDDEGNPVFISTVEAVTLVMNNTTVIDLESQANLCVNCHQPRTPAPVDDDGDGMFTVTSSHWGPHHGPQAVLLEGLGGAEFAGSVSYPGTKSHPHRKSADCVKCHMNEGNHNFAAPETSACSSCHGDIDDFDVNGKLTEILSLMEELAEMLTEKGLLLDGHPNPGTYPVEEVAALYNFLLIEEDKSEGLHNPTYAEALLTNTIEAISEATAAN